MQLFRKTIVVYIQDSSLRNVQKSIGCIIIKLQLIGTATLNYQPIFIPKIKLQLVAQNAVLIYYSFKSDFVP